MTVVELLTRARKRIERPECWTQEHAARDVNGRHTFAAAPTAVSWCAVGAVEAEQPKDTNFHAALYRLRTVMGVRIAHFNDNNTHAEVLAAFDRAIELARKDPP